MVLHDGLRSETLAARLFKLEAFGSLHLRGRLEHAPGQTFAPSTLEERDRLDHKRFCFATKGSFVHEPFLRCSAFRERQGTSFRPGSRQEPAVRTPSRAKHVFYGRRLPARSFPASLHAVLDRAVPPRRAMSVLSSTKPWLTSSLNSIAFGSHHGTVRWEKFLSTLRYMDCVFCHGQGRVTEPKKGRSHETDGRARKGTRHFLRREIHARWSRKTPVCIIDTNRSSPRRYSEV